eukprot:5869339-Pyramimonas_sp.AAC.1
MYPREHCTCSRALKVAANAAASPRTHAAAPRSVPAAEHLVAPAAVPVARAAALPLAAASPRSLQFALVAVGPRVVAPGPVRTVHSHPFPAIVLRPFVVAFAAASPAFPAFPAACSADPPAHFLVLRCLRTGSHRALSHELGRR